MLLFHRGKKIILGLCYSTVLARVKDRERERGIEEDRDIENEREIG